MHEQNNICSKIHLEGITREQSIICWQLFAGSNDNGHCYRFERQIPPFCHNTQL